MGSVLNFILPYKHGEFPNWCIHGPISNKVCSDFSYTIFPKYKSNYKNFILIEPSEALKGFVYNIEYLVHNNIKQFMYDNNIMMILASIADPPSDENYLLLLEELKKFELLDRTIILSSNMALKYKNLHCFNYFVEDFIKYKHSFYGKTDLGYVSEEIQEHEINNFRNKKFLSFNRTIDKEHRYSLYHDYLTNDFSDSYFSFLNLEGIHCDPYQKEKLKLEEYQNKLPIELDTNGIFNFSTHNTFKKELFLNSCIHIVTETSFRYNELFVSEKVLKPVLNYQPFIVLGPVNYLKELKRLGLKTFSDFWDESYDDIEDAEQRYFAVSKIILDLNRRTIEELNNLYQDAKEITIYNKNFLNNLQLNELDTFLRNLKNLNEK